MGLGIPAARVLKRHMALWLALRLLLKAADGILWVDDWLDDHPIRLPATRP